MQAMPETNHVAKVCELLVRCLVCEKSIRRNVSLLVNENYALQDVKDDLHEEVHWKPSCLSYGLLQTLRCVVRSGRRQKQVRALLDSESQRSYILEKTAEESGLVPEGEVQLCHLLFSGLKQK